MEGRIYTTLKNAYDKAIGQGIETIQELDEECTQSNVQTGSQTDHMISNKGRSPLTKELSKSKSRDCLNHINKENHDSNTNPKSADPISEFNEGTKNQVALTSPSLKKPICSPKPFSKSHSSSTNNFGFGLVSRVTINENLKFSFQKPDEVNTPLENPKVFVSSKVSSNLLQQSVQVNTEGSKATKSLNRSNTNEYLSFKDSVSKSSSMVPKKSRELAQKKLFRSEKTFIDKSLKLRDKGQGFFNRKVTFAIPNFTNLLKQTKDVTQTMIQTNYPTGPRCDDKTVNILFQKSKEKISRDVSANSKSSKESHDYELGLVRMTKDKKNKSYLDLRAQQLHNLPRSSTLKFHKV